MDPRRRFWNVQQQELQKALERGDEPQKVIPLFLDHHAMVHSGRLVERSGWSFEDEAMDGLKEADFRIIPPGEDHSIGWIIWHLARIEDVTMNVLVAGTPQVFQAEGWVNKVGIDTPETGNALDPIGIRRLSEMVNITALRDYRLAVGNRTREIVKSLRPSDYRQKVDPAQLDQIMAEGAVVDSTRWLADYWGKKTFAGLLLMPPTRHNFVHLNEAIRIKKKIQLRRNVIIST